MKETYHHLPIAKEIQSYLTVNAHIGLFVFKNLPNVIHSGTSIFQIVMDNLFSDIQSSQSSRWSLSCRYKRRGSPSHTASSKMGTSCLFQWQPWVSSHCSHADADITSWLPRPQTWSPKREYLECYFLGQWETQVKPVLSQVYKYVINGWPRLVDPGLIPFNDQSIWDKHATRLHLVGCSCNFSSITVAEKFGRTISPGDVSNESFGHIFCVVPDMDSQIEGTVALCSTCKSVRADPCSFQTQSCAFPGRPWSRIHKDLVGPTSG